MQLGTQPRFRLGNLPTPLEEAPRLRAALGGDGACPRILIKRDDLTGLAFGGNKVRKLEFLVADALARQATTLITSGAIQSNHARLTAAAARVAGLRSVLVLDTAEENPAIQGNLLLDRLLGAETRFVPAGADMDAAMADVARELESAGERPYVITGGGSNAIGVLGYVAATLELLEQTVRMGIAPSRLYYANGSRGTQAGLALGAKVWWAPWTVQGIAVSGGEPEKIHRAVRIAGEAARLIGADVMLQPDDLINDNDYIGPGYGVLTEGCVEAIALTARTEGIFLDPVYSGKAMAGMIRHIRAGTIDPAETVVFLHTGGTPALFARADDLVGALESTKG
jgi:D-cysteine desulfhydrase family pyridoxal phosphate-dependent enzyme